MDDSTNGDQDPLLQVERKRQTVHKTRSRILAEVLAKFNWYYPRSRSKFINLAEGWNYFEFYSLPRYVDPHYVNGYEDADKEYLLAERGEKEKVTHLYPLSIKENVLYEFGLSVGLYFTQMRLFAIQFFVAFLFNIPLIYYYISDAYSKTQNGVPLALRGSAVCMEQHWQPCPSCTPDEFSDNLFQNYERFAIAGSNSSFKFVLVNNCSVGFYAGLSSSAAWLILFLWNIWRRKNEKKRIARYEKDFHPTEEYSIVVLNPPADAKDPEEWKAFFSNLLKDVHVTCCTIKLANNALVNAIAERKSYFFQLQELMPQGQTLSFETTTDVSKFKKFIDELPPIPWWQKPFVSSQKYMFKKIVELDASLELLSEKEYDAHQVFVTIENKKDQQRILNRLQVSFLSVSNQDRGALPTDHLFRGKHVLNVRQPGSPLEINWACTKGHRLQYTASTALSIIVIVASAAIITYITKRYPGVFFGFTSTALAITFFNYITPTIIKFITKLESHWDEGTKTASYFFKLCLFRWTNLSIVLLLIFPFTSTLNSQFSFTQTVYSLFIAEIVSTPIIQISDFFGHFGRHFLAVRANSQRKANLYFRGTLYDLAERYTAMNKVLFLSIFYAAVFPLGFLYSSISLTVHYFTDKFCILRVWSMGPKLNSQLSATSNVFNICIGLIFTVRLYMSWGGFPYDNACYYEGNNTLDILHQYSGEHTITDLKGGNYTVNITSDDKVYEFCTQNMLYVSTFPFYKIRENDNRMTDNQYLITVTCGWISLLSCVPVAFYFTTEIIRGKIRNFFYGKPQERIDENVLPPPFTRLEYESVYIPNMMIPFGLYPELTCDIRDLNERFIAWDVPDDYDSFNLMCATKKILEAKGKDTDVRNIFDKFHFWDPPNYRSHTVHSISDSFFSHFAHFDNVGDFERSEW